MHVLEHSLPIRLKTDIYVGAKGKIFQLGKVHFHRSEEKYHERFCIYLCMHIYNVCVSVCVHIISVCLCACMGVCIHMNIYLGILFMYTYVCLHVYAYSKILTVPM